MVQYAHCYSRPGLRQAFWIKRKGTTDERRLWGRAEEEKELLPQMNAD